MIAIVSDTHMPRGGRRIPETCLRQLRAAELILHAGDIAAAEILRALEALGAPVLAVAGNVDEPVLRHELPTQRVVEHAGARIGMVHDAGARIGRLGRLRQRFPDCHAVVFGHSHIPLIEHDEEGFTIVNPGSPTERRRASTHTMALASAGSGGLEVQLVSLD